MPGRRPPRAVPRPVAEEVVEVLDALLDDGVGLTGDNLVRPHLILEILDEVRAEDRPEAAERHRRVEVETAAHDRPLGQVVLGQQEHAEGAQAGVAESQLVALVVLPEPAGAASAGRQIDVALGRFLDPVLLRLPPDEVDQVARREARGTALADVGDLPAGEKILPRGHGEDLGAIAAVFQHGLDQPLDAPVQPAEEDRHRIALGAGEGPRSICAVVLGDGRGHCGLPAVPTSGTPEEGGDCRLLRCDRSDDSTTPLTVSRPSCSPRTPRPSRMCAASRPHARARYEHWPAFPCSRPPGVWRSDFCLLAAGPVTRLPLRSDPGRAVGTRDCAALSPARICPRLVQSPPRRRGRGRCDRETCARGRRADRVERSARAGANRRRPRVTPEGHRRPQGRTGGPSPGAPADQEPAERVPPAPRAGGAAPEVVLTVRDGPSKGSKDAKVTLVEFTDYQ